MFFIIESSINVNENKIELIYEQTSYIFGGAYKERRLDVFR